MKNFGGKAAKFIQKKFDHDGPSRHAQVVKADTARDSGQWLTAAELYLAAAKTIADRPDLLVQAGNCFKECGKFGAALEAYRGALTHSQSADCEVQLGHLFKISGNFAAAARAYRRGAALGDPNGAAEVENLPILRPTALKLPASSGLPANPPTIPQATFEAVVACDLGDAIDTQTLRRAGRLLASAGENQSAKAFIELAYMASWPSPKADEHLEVVLRSGLWPLTHLGELARAQEVRAASRAQGTRARLFSLVSAAVAGLGDQPEPKYRERPSGKPNHSWPPSALPAADAGGQIDALAAEISRFYEALALRRAGAEGQLTHAVQQLASSTQPATTVVALPENQSTASLRLIVARVLGDCVARWIDRVESRYFGPSVTAGTLEIIHRLGGNPIEERASEVGSPATVFHEINAMLLAALPENLASSRDLLLSRIFAVCLPEIPSEHALMYCEEAARDGLSLTATTLLDRFSSAGLLSEDETFAFARTLKAIGFHQRALSVIEANLDEGATSVHALVEKALVAKIVGDFPLAARLLEACLERDPDSEFLRLELVAVLPEIEPIHQIVERYRDDPLFLAAARRRASFRLALAEEYDYGTETKLDGELCIGDLAPEIALELSPTSVSRLPNSEEIRILEMGWQRRRGINGTRRQLRRIDFVRVRVSSERRIELLRVRIDGRTIAVTRGERLQADHSQSNLFHHLFNCWMDLSGIETGLHEVQLYFEEREGGYRACEEVVWIDPSPYPADFERSAAAVELPPATTENSVDERIAKQPSVVFKADRHLFSGHLDRILLLRADQLGDTAQSIAAMLALKDAFPSATFDCLTSPGNRELLLSIDGLFDEVHCVELTHDTVTRRRYSTLAEQLRLRKLFAAKRYDLAVDLSPGFETQNLLRLTQARHTAAFKPNDFRWTTFGADIQTHDPLNQREMMPHSAMINSFVASLIAMVKHRPLVLPRKDADPALISELGISPGEPYAVLHSGARLDIKRWPLTHYLELARLITSLLGLKTVLLADDPAAFATQDFSDFPSGKLIPFADKMSFRVFDSLLSRCAVFVGNDTGPKHLAMLRGAPVVSVHMGQVNWSEWGQEGSGLIVARRVPCVGCGIERVEECGKGLPCLVDIAPKEVFAAVDQLLRETETPTAI